MARRGRPRKTAKREPNGRVLRKPRFETEADVMETAMSARLRAGIPQHLARSVGTIEAALFANADLNRDQYEAAVFYNQVRLKYLSAIDEPHSAKEPRRPSQGGGEEAHEKFCQLAREQWEAMRAEVMDLQRQLGNTANLFGALDSLERGHLMNHQHGDLRYALNAIHKYRVSTKRRAA